MASGKTKISGKHLVQRPFLTVSIKTMLNLPVLITGAAGLIGAHLAKKLIARGTAVTATYHLRKLPYEVQRSEQCDLTLYEDCLKVTQGMGTVFICAAQSFGAKMMKEHPTAAILPNHKIVLGLLQASAANRVKNIVLVSSATVYQPLPFPIAEDDLDLNAPPYDLYYHVGWANRYAELAAMGFARAYGMNLLLVRPSSVYGPLDQFDDDKSHVIPALIKRALKRETPFVVWGHKETVRDFIFVEDAADDIVDLYAAGCFGEPINLAHGKTISIEETAKIVLNVCGHETEPAFDCSKPEGIPYRAFSIAKLESKLGKRRRTPFREGLQKTVAWYQRRLEGHS
jgi:GDP-L-fucose synthase